ncbi:SDR family oxidoreductase [Microbacterium rhizophilus]|uniref:SDR family oxidoreductase n=1 Tax=Microbacterium rhizophilus TaxID=3138934 RepID=UPI0031EEE3F0
MRVFITGASGYIGRAVVAELVAAGHDVVGMARSQAAAETVAALGANVRRGELDDLDAIRAGAADADGVIHLANKHDWANPAESDRAERAAVGAIAEQLQGTGKPFLLAAGVAGLTPGRPVTELDPNPSVGPESMRGGAENLALEYVTRGVRVVPVRFAPTVHGEGDHGFVAAVAQAARRRGSVPYVGDGVNRWPAVHRSDAARLVRLGLETAEAGAILHAVGEEGSAVRRMAEALAERLELPAVSVDAETLAAEIPFIGRILGLDIPASSALTRERTGWEPSGPTLLADIRAGHYDA